MLKREKYSTAQKKPQNLLGYKAENILDGAVKENQKPLVAIIGHMQKKMEAKEKK